MPGEIISADPKTVQLLVGKATFVEAMTVKLMGVTLVKLKRKLPSASHKLEVNAGGGGGDVTMTVREAVATPPNAFVVV